MLCRGPRAGEITWFWGRWPLCWVGRLRTLVWWEDLSGPITFRFGIIGCSEANLPAGVTLWRMLRSKIWWLADSAIRIAYRSLLRSSSLWEPRYPPLKIFSWFFWFSSTGEPETDFFHRRERTSVSYFWGLRRPPTSTLTSPRHLDAILRFLENRDFSKPKFQFC